MVKGDIMAKVRLNFSIDEDVAKRFNEVTKRLKLNKSAIIEEFIEGILPILEQTKKETMLQKILEMQAKTLNETANLVDFVNNNDTKD